MDLATAAAQLYALLPDEFTAARNDQAKAVRGEGDRELADRIRRFRKPSTAAWVVNLLARHDSGTVEEIVDLGTAMRQAQQDQDGEALRRLNRRRRDVLTAAVREGRNLAAERGHQVSDSVAADVEQSLWAAMTDAGAAAAVRSGQLVTALSTTGLGPVDVEGAVAVPSAVQPIEERPRARPAARKRGEAGRRKEPAQKGPTPKETTHEGPTHRQPSERALRQARQRAEDAERDLDEAEERLAEAQREVDDAVSRREGLAGELADLQNRLRWTEKQIQRTDREVARAEKERDQADRRTGSAQRTAERARQHLARLEDEGS